ncbi:MAG TPA: S41 family peptidase [Fimbriimonadaceae bacterium]|nr:S41 family peptidase [Fimbriimonadaceae bacterium]
MTSALLILVAAQAQIDFAKSWDQAASSIRRMYYARDTRKAEMDGLLSKYEPKAKAAKSKSEFRDVVNAMIADFKDSHFALLTDEDQGYYSFDSILNKDPALMPHVGAWFKQGPDGYTVQMVIDGGEAQKADLRKGDFIVSCDGKPFTPISSLKDKVEKSVTFSVRRGSNTLTKSLGVKSESAKAMFLNGTRSSARVIEHGGRSFGYVHLWTMVDEDQKTALHNLVNGRFRDTDAMILDIRDGFGGRPEGYGDPFFRPAVDLEWKFGPAMTQKQAFGYGKPLILITNGGSRSAKEVFSYVMKKSGRATLVGSTTSGHVLGTTPMRLNEWAFLEIPIVDVITDGMRLEGKGVSPDIVVPVEYDESGKDLYLEKAIEVAVSKAELRKAPGRS